MNTNAKNPVTSQGDDTTGKVQPITVQETNDIIKKFNNANISTGLNGNVIIECSGLAERNLANVYTDTHVLAAILSESQVSGIYVRTVNGNVSFKIEGITQEELENLIKNASDSLDSVTKTANINAISSLVNLANINKIAIGQTDSILQDVYETLRAVESTDPGIINLRSMVNGFGITDEELNVLQKYANEAGITLETKNNTINTRADWSPSGEDSITIGDLKPIDVKFIGNDTGSKTREG